MMPWTYCQESGDLHHGEEHVARGYSGFGVCKNDPQAQDKKTFGPIPRGRWLVGEPIDEPGGMGPFCLKLVPEAGTETYGRSNFWIHGDSLSHPGEASRGCIILPREVREQIWTSGDHHLVVMK